MISAGISQIGGKFRLRKELLNFTPYHDFFLSGFAGACWFELNKPRSRYECFNDKDSDYINYLLMIRQYPNEFDDMKKGVFGLVSQEICNRITSGELKPRNNLEKAYFFYYLNKLTFGGKPSKGYAGILQENNTKNPKFRGITLPTVCKRKTIEKVKANYRGISPKQSNFYKGINPKTTRPYSNNDNGLLTPLNPKTIERIRYVNITCYDFRKVYKMFHRAFYEKKALTKECFIYFDPPYPATEKYYNGLFFPEDHQDLIEIMLDSPFNIMLSIGGECDFYLEKLTDWNIQKVYTKYSTSANTQSEVREFVIMNYDIKKHPKMIMDYQVPLTKYMEA